MSIGTPIPANEKIRVAVIGCGRFSPSFVPLFKVHPAVEEVYVCDLKRERAEDFAQRFDVKIIDSFEDALASKRINAIAIFTQRFKHGKMVIEALKAGKHVYSAVPCTVETEDIPVIAELVQKTGLTYSMGETGFYRAPTVFCRNEFRKGSFGQFVYGEAQYNHDIRNMEQSFRSSGGEDWRKYAGIPPLYYPTHSTSMILGAMPGVYAKKVTAFGFSGSKRTDIFGRDGQNLYDNPFSNTSMMLELSNGGIARISENRCIGWRSPETYISQFYGDCGCYEFSVAHHHFATWSSAPTGDSDMVSTVDMQDVTDQLQPKSVSDLIHKDYAEAIHTIGNGMGFLETSPVQPTQRLPKEFEGQRNGHNGTHQFLIDDFCRACMSGKLSPTNIWQVARFNLPGLVGHKSAMLGGQVLDIPDIGDAPEGWEVIDY